MPNSTATKSVGRRGKIPDSQSRPGMAGLPNQTPPATLKKPIAALEAGDRQVGLENRDYYRAQWGGSGWGTDSIPPVCKYLIIANVVVFLLQVFTPRGASGAVMGVVMLYAIHFPRKQILVFTLVPIEICWLVALYLIFDLVRPKYSASIETPWKYGLHTRPRHESQPTFGGVDEGRHGSQTAPIRWRVPATHGYFGMSRITTVVRLPNDPADRVVSMRFDTWFPIHSCARRSHRPGARKL